ncbi:hypothetical protein Hanom_Chr13g01194281 [Helianthus anomalus]
MVNRAGLTHWSRQEGLIPSPRGSLAGSPVDDLLHKETSRDSRLMDGLTTCCALAGVSGLSVVEVTPRQSIASVALTSYCHWCHLHCGVSHLQCGVSPTC